MQITDAAREIIQNVLEKNGAKNIRVYFAGVFWGSLQLGLSLDEVNEQEDTVDTINGIVVAIENTILENTKGLSFDVQNGTLVIVENAS